MSRENFVFFISFVFFRSFFSSEEETNIPVFSLSLFCLRAFCVEKRLCLVISNAENIRYVAEHGLFYIVYKNIIGRARTLACLYPFVSVRKHAEENIYCGFARAGVEHLSELSVALGLVVYPNLGNSFGMVESIGYIFTLRDGGYPRNKRAVCLGNVYLASPLADGGQNEVTLVYAGEFTAYFVRDNAYPVCAVPYGIADIKPNYIILFF